MAKVVNTTYDLLSPSQRRPNKVVNTDGGGGPQQVRVVECPPVQAEASLTLEVRFLLTLVAVYLQAPAGAASICGANP